MEYFETYIGKVVKPEKWEKRNLLWAKVKTCSLPQVSTKSPNDNIKIQIITPVWYL